MKYARTVRGFTLIELLVVIAIIGILSAVVLASLNSARTKGNDASVKANLHTVQTQSAIYSNEHNNTYGVFDNGSGGPADCPLPGATTGTIFDDSTVASAIKAALNNTNGGTAKCIATNTNYAVAVSRPTGPVPPSTYWCVDDNTHNCGVNSNALVGSTCGTCDSVN